MGAAAPYADLRVVRSQLQRPNALILFASALAIAIVGFIDAFTGPDFSVLTFYFVPVLFSTWFVGRAAGTTLSVISSAEWVVIDLLVNGGHIGHGVSAWNAAIHLALFIGGVWSIGELKEALERKDREERRRVAAEIETAREVQNALLPHDLEKQLRGFEVAASFEPAVGISGDFYELTMIDDGRLQVALGDVSGKGVAAGLLGATLLGGLRSLAPLHAGRIDRLVGHLNTMLQKTQSRSRFATLFAGEYDYESSTLRWVNAGHTTGLLFTARDERPVRLDSTGTVVGLFASAQWRQRETRLEEGDVLILFSDGISEAADAAGVEFGEERIIAAAAEALGGQAQAIHRSILNAVLRHTGGAALSDDRTLVVLRRRG